MGNTNLRECLYNKHIMKKRLAQIAFVLRISLEEQLIYRTEFALGTVLRFLPVLTQIFLWMTIFAVVGRHGEIALAGYDQDAMIGYYLLTMLVRTASATPGVAAQIAHEIRTGAFRRYLVQPIDFLEFTFLNQCAHKTVWFLSGIVPLGVMFWCCRSFLPDFPPLLTLSCFLVAVSMAFLLAFLMDAIIGMISFWFLEISSLLFVYILMLFFFSGQMFPLELLPGPLDTLSQWLPFRYFVWFPTAILLDRLTLWEILRGLGTECVWIGVSLVVLRRTFTHGVRRYAGYGG